MKLLSEKLVAGKMGEYLDSRYSPWLDQARQNCELPGLAVGVVAQGETAYARALGVIHSGQTAPVNLHTIFHLASVSKPFSATAILQLAAQGLVALEAPVITYLPYFKLADERYRQITVQQMLSHIAGMPDEDDYEWLKPQYDAGALERYVHSLEEERLIAAPGEKFAYSNIAFECLGALIAQVSGLSFDDYIQQYILEPAGMSESSFLKPPHLPENWAAPHVRLLADTPWDGYPYNRRHAPSSTLHSNVMDMCRWAITNLQRGTIAGRQVLQPEAYDLLWTPRAKVGPARQVGLSWFLGERHGERVVQHGGGDVGFSSYFALLPERMAGVVVLCNIIPAPVKTIAEAALDLLQGYEPPPQLPSASLAVSKTYATSGLAAAADHWKALKTGHPGEYDFALDQIEGLYLARSAGMPEEGAELARLCSQILTQAEKDEFAGILRHWQA